jgi:hypothetical protein
MDIVIVKELDNNSNVENSEAQTYIKSQGMSQTFIQQPGTNRKMNQINWDADYNGEIAKLNLDVNTNGKKENFMLQLSKGDLENLLNIPSIDKSIEKRLEDDFLIKDDFTPTLQYKPLPLPYLFRPSVYPKTRCSSKFNNNHIESQIKDELNKMTSQDEASLQSELKNLLLLKKKLKHPYTKKHSSHRLHYKPHSHDTTHKKEKTFLPIKNDHSLTKKKKKEYKTPSPKTMRIHLTDDHDITTPLSSSSKKRSTRKKRKSSSPSSFLRQISDLIQD